MMKEAFLSNAQLLFQQWGTVPLLYGSLGLECLTGETLNADAIDILIPEIFLHSRWAEFQGVLVSHGYRLVDEGEHTFEKEGIAYSYASIEELESFAGIPLCEIGQCACDGVNFRLLTLEQYQRVYTASSKDGYRMKVRQKKDAQKLALIQKHLGR